MKIPNNIKYYQEEVIGNIAYINAAKDIAEGKTVAFAGCVREPEGSAAEVEQVHKFAWGYNAVRYCGEDDNPEGVGSHTLTNSTDTAIIGIALVRAMRKWPWVFRIDELELSEELPQFIEMVSRLGYDEEQTAEVRELIRQEWLTMGGGKK